MTTLPLRLLMLAAVPVVLSGTGCKSESSKDLATDEIAATFEVEVDDRKAKRTRLTASFRKAALTSVRLEGGDVVSMTTDKDATLDVKVSDSDLYSADVAATDRTMATFTLARASGTKLASTATIPDALAFSAPTDGADVSYGDGSALFAVTWSNPVAGATVRMNVSPCDGLGTIQTAEIPDTGKLEVPTSKLVVGAPASASCQTLTFSRFLAGTLSPGFKDGSKVTATRIGEVQVNVVP